MSATPTTPAPGQQLDPYEQLGLAFKSAMAAVRRLRGRETHHPAALSSAQYGLLFSLAGGREMSARELADAAALAPATVTQMLEGLEAHGLVERLRSAADRRVVLTALTDRGNEVVEQHRARVEPRWRAALSEFGPEQLTIAAAVLKRLARHFDELYESGIETPPADALAADALAADALAADALAADALLAEVPPAEAPPADRQTE